MTDPIEPYGQQARIYYAAGWAVLPLPLGAKSPVPIGFTGHTGAMPSRADIEAWCEDRPASNIAIRTPHLVIGVDVDAYQDKAGRETLAKCSAEWGPLPATWMTTARHDGLSGIRLFRILVEGLRWPSIVGPGIEVVRFGHRYAVVWPSVHPEGGTYRWIRPDGFDAADGQIPQPWELPVLPDRWTDELTAGGQLEAEHTVGIGTDDERTAWMNARGAGQPCGFVRAVLRHHLEAYVAGSARHDWMVAAVWAMVLAGAEGHPGTGYGLRTISTRWAELTAGELGRDSGGEWHRAVMGAAGKAMADTEGLTVGPDRCTPAPSLENWAPPASSGATVAAGDPMLIPTAGGAPDTVAAATAPRLELVADPLEPDEDTAAALPVEVVDWATTMAAGIPAIEWVVANLIPAGPRVVMVWSVRSGDGKTMLAWELAVAIAAGRTVFAREGAGLAVLEPRKVLVLDYENSARLDIWPRLSAMGITAAREVAGIVLVEYAAGKLPPLDTAEGGLTVLELARAVNAEVVIIDTANRAVAGNPNDDTTWGAFDRLTLARLKARGITTISLAQAGKDADRGPRGSRAMVDSLDVEWRLEAIEPDHRVLTVGKSRVPLEIREHTLRIVTEPLGHVTAGPMVSAAELAADSLEHRIQAAIDAGLISLESSGNAVALAIHARKDRVLIALKRMRERAGTSYVPPSPEPTGTDGHDESDESQ